MPRRLIRRTIPKPRRKSRPPGTSLAGPVDSLDVPASLRFGRPRDIVDAAKHNVRRSPERLPVLRIAVKEDRHRDVDRSCRSLGLAGIADLEMHFGIG